MLKLMIILIFLAVVILGDIIWDGIETALWFIRQNTWRLNFLKRRRPPRTRRDYR